MLSELALDLSHSISCLLLAHTCVGVGRTFARKMSSIADCVDLVSIYNINSNVRDDGFNTLVRVKKIA